MATIFTIGVIAATVVGGILGLVQGIQAAIKRHQAENAQARERRQAWIEANWPSRREGDEGQWQRLH